MEYMTKMKLLEKLKGKEYLSLDDFLQIIQEEFNVSLDVNNGNEIKVEEIIENPSIIRQICSSRIDRKAGRSYSGEKGLDFLRGKIEEFDNESNL